jgi:hypothetical protein
VLESIDRQTLQWKNLIHRVGSAGGFECCYNTLFAGHLLIPCPFRWQSPVMSSVSLGSDLVGQRLVFVVQMGFQQRR